MYVHGGCYQLTTSTSLTWFAAATACEQQSAYLAVPRSESEARWVHEMFFVRYPYATTVANVWLGINDISTEGDWQPTDGGGELDFLYWSANEPNNAGGLQNCVAMSTRGTAMWSDNACSTPSQGLCKYNTTVAPMPEGNLCSVVPLLYVLSTMICA